jgi:acetoin utilization deacetylase AcuC-like enzyme
MLTKMLKCLFVICVSFILLTNDKAIANSKEVFFDDLLTNKELDYVTAASLLEKNKEQLGITSYSYYRIILQLQRNLQLDPQTVYALLDELKNLYTKDHPWYEFTMREYRRLKKEWTSIISSRQMVKSAKRSLESSNVDSRKKQKLESMKEVSLDPSFIQRIAILKESLSRQEIRSYSSILEKPQRLDKIAAAVEAKLAVEGGVLDAYTVYYEAGGLYNQGLLETVFPGGRSRWEQLLNLSRSGEQDRGLFEECHISQATPDAIIGSYNLLSAEFKTLMQNSNIAHSFAAIRPPGHHADYKFSSGFCFACNIIHAYLSAIESGHIKKTDPILIVDIDLHAGNGTCEWVKKLLKDGYNLYFLNLYCSNQYPWAQGAPFDEYEGHIYNVALSPGTKIESYVDCLKKSLASVIIQMQTQPEVVLISAGFDTAKKDKKHLGGIGFDFSVEDYKVLSYELKRSFAAEKTPKFFSLLEGGYDLSEIGARVVNYLEGFCFN